MSHNRPRGERSEPTQYRRTGRFVSSNQQQGQFSSAAPSKGGSGGGGGGSSAPTNPSNRSLKKYNNNAPVGQPNEGSHNVDSGNSHAASAVENGAHPQQPTHRVSDTPVVNVFSNVKPTGAPTQNITPSVPRAPSSNVSSFSSEFNAPRTPEKGDASKSFALQFGSISPGVMNRMQIPARTNSAPPNLDEQKKFQARHDNSRAPPVPFPSVPNQHLLEKDASNNASEAQQVSKSKRDAKESAAPPVTQKPSLHPPIPGMPRQVSFHHQQVPVHFSGQNPQVQSQTMSGTSLPIPVPITFPLGNPPVSHSMFVPGLHPHPTQSQGMMHQRQSLNVSSQMGPQLPPHFGSMRMNMAPQFTLQPPVRKTVKTTYPETREELRLDGSHNLRVHPNVQSQSQPISLFPPNILTNFYSSPYNAVSLFFLAPGSVPLSSTQVPPTSQPPSLDNQVTVKPPMGSNVGKEPMPPTSSLSVGTTDSSKPSRLQGGDYVFLKRETGMQAKPGLGASSGSASTISSIDAIKDKHKRPGNRSQQGQVGSLSTSASSVPSQMAEAEEKSASYGSSLISEAKESIATHECFFEEKTGDASKGSALEVKNSRQSTPETMGGKDQRVATFYEGSKPDNRSLETSLRSLALESPKTTVKVEESSDREVMSSTSGVLEHAQKERGDDVKVHVNLAAPAGSSGGLNTENSVSEPGLSVDKIATSDASLSVPHSTDWREVCVAKYAEETSASVSVPSLTEDALRSGDEYIDSSSNGELVRPSSSSAKDKFLSDGNVAKRAVPRGKKKMKNLYRRAEAADTSADIYMAYKDPEEKKRSVTPADGSENSPSISEKQNYIDVPPEKAAPCQQPSKVDPDNWEDAAEMSIPRLETSNNVNQSNDRDVDGSTTKKYLRDFLLKFQDLYNDRPYGFDVTSDVEATLMVSSHNVSRVSHPSLGRSTERPSGGSRLDCCGSGLGDGDKRNKFTGPLMPGRGNMPMDIGHVSNSGGFRSGQGGNYGVLRNNWGTQAPVQYVGGYSGPMQSFGAQGGLQKNNSQSVRWQCATGFQKGFIPYSQTPMQVMHKAEKKYEVGRVTDEEQAKQRQLKGILNKLTPQNFEKLFQQVKQVNIDNVTTLSGVISQIFDKALMEPTFCEMYANFCFHLAADLQELNVDNEKITFKRLLLNKCQEEFERGESEEQEANKAEEEGEVKQTAEEREENRLRIRRRMLGNIRLIGELYKKRMLTERIMHECINKLLGHSQNPGEENLEALCKLMSTIGEMIDHPKAKEFMDAYFDIMLRLSNNMKLSSRLRFMLKDTIDLRKNKWQQRRKVEGPKKIEEVHRDAAQERHAQASRLSRVPSMGNPARRTHMEFTPRSSSGVAPQIRGFGFQDARTEEIHSYEDRTISVPLTQRPFGDNSITLGPDGGLASGMAFRGKLLAPNMGSGHNGFGSIPQRAPNGQREDPVWRYTAEGFSTPIYDQSHPHKWNITCGNQDVRNVDSMLNVASDEVSPEEHLRKKSLLMISEFYSARDLNEVAFCIKDLNTPRFHPSMISIWVTHSFERNDVERDLLAKLLIYLTKHQDGMISKDQLIKGFEYVLAGLEDAIRDAPKAAEYLGRIFTKVVLEGVIPLAKIEQLIYEGEEEKGRLVELGLAAKVIGSIRDIITLEKGESLLNEIRSSCKLQLGQFRPPVSNNPLRKCKFF